jgi:glucuronoxylan 4-O-methyltransferase
MTLPDAGYIDALVANNPDQMKAPEYRAIAETIASKSPCNLLVFGVGNDSELWYLSNPGGTTLFVEDCQEWIDHVRRIYSHVPLQIYRHQVRTRVREYSNLFWPGKDAMAVPATLREIVWDVIVVDGPMGHRKEDPGRVQPIAWAGRLARTASRPVDIFVHDIHRPTEFLAASRFLGASRQAGQVEHLGRFRFDPSKRGPWPADAVTFFFRFGRIALPRLRKKR